MKEDILKLISRSLDCLEDAKLIYQTGRYTSVPNRSYYAIFDAINALLRLHDLYANSHRGAKNRFSELFIKTGLMPRESNIWLEGCLELRQSGDYDFDYEVTEADAQKSIQYASDFIVMPKPIYILSHFSRMTPFKILVTSFITSFVTLQTAFGQTTSPTSASAKSQSAVVGQPGLAIYKQYCLTCHQVDGGGVPNLNPPLRGTDWVNGDKARLIGVLLKGLQGVEIEGESYDNVMPAHDFLTDQQLADVLTYIRSNFTNKATPITAAEVKQQRGK